MPDSKHLTHKIAIPGLLATMVRYKHLTKEQAEKMAVGFCHLNNEETLFVTLAMGNEEGESFRLEQLSEFDWRILRGLIIARRVEIEEVLGIQYVRTRDFRKTVEYLRSLGLME